MDQTDKQKIESYLRRGWCPVAWKHHPPHVRAAIREARMVPKLKGCFENAQKLVLRVPEFTYVEGWVCASWKDRRKGRGGARSCGGAAPTVCRPARGRSDCPGNGKA